MHSSTSLKTILAIKIKRLRKRGGWTLRELSQATGMSISYLAEIEGGKKFPKPDRILKIASALQSSYDELTSSALESEFDGLQSFMASETRNLPLDFFGVPTGDVMKLLVKAPMEVTALIRTLHEVARQYDIGVEHFLHATLRSSLELSENAYPDIDVAADRFGEVLDRMYRKSRGDQSLRRWLLSNGIAEIDDKSLSGWPVLSRYRSVRLQRPVERLLINPCLTPQQKRFVLAREAGYIVLNLKSRSLTAPPNREESFEQVRNDFQASYFAAALLMPRKSLAEDLHAFFRLQKWQPSVLLTWLRKYRVTPETLMIRISQLVPTEFGLRSHFLKFSEQEGRIKLLKVVNLSGLPMLSGVHAKEQYCRRWLATRLLREFRARQDRSEYPESHVHIGAQYSRFAENGDRYFNLSIALPQPLQSGTAITLTVGCKVDERTLDTIRFAQDPAIPEFIVGGTCERCGLNRGECEDRAAPPIIYLRQKAKEKEGLELARLVRSSA